MKPTSIKSYHEILPILGDMQREVFNTIKIMEPCSARAVTERMREKGFESANKRFSELERIGLISAFGYGKDPKTRKTVTLWKTNRFGIIGGSNSHKKNQLTPLERTVKLLGRSGFELNYPDNATLTIVIDFDANGKPLRASLQTQAKQI